MSSWENFEINCTDYLNKTFGSNATFIHMGGADSTKPDILVKTKSGKELFFEAKHSPAQCGQFVLLPDISTSSFKYSDQNASLLNEYSKKIMEVMNKDFDSYREAGTKGKSISFPDCQKTFSNWITNYYKGKGVEFFITNNYKVIPIDSFYNSFSITASYRIKRSGSTSVSSQKKDIVIDYIKKNIPFVNSIRYANKKLFVKALKNIHDTRFILNGYEYMISQRDDNYEVRQLSNTYNANVIFSIELKPGAPFISDNQLAAYLK